MHNRLPSGKRQLNQLMTFLDKGSNMKESLGGRSDNALRTVRAKREADEAGLCHSLYLSPCSVYFFWQTRSTARLYTGTKHFDFVE